MATSLSTGASPAPEEQLPAPAAFTVEARGIEHIPANERWANPKAIAAMWAGATVNVENYLYGAILIGFGFSFIQTMALIIIGNCSYALLALASLQGPTTGTTTFNISTAPFGSRGARILAFFNWITMIGFEAEGLILVVGAASVLARHFGITPTSSSKAALLFVALGIQLVLPFLGHATIVKVLRVLLWPFVAIFVAVGIATAHAMRLPVHSAPSITWQVLLVGLAFTIALSGLGWSECGNDYSRYLPADTPKKATAAWIFLSTALPQIAMMTLGALTFTAIGTANGGAVWNSANPFDAFTNQHIVPSPLVVAFTIAAIIQLFAINSLDLYSSGVSLQAMGLKVRRAHAVLIDGALCLAITAYAIFDATFSGLLKDFVGIIIVWLAPWCAIFLVDWALRGRTYRHVSFALDGTSENLAFDHRYNTAGLVSLVIGMVASVAAFADSATFTLPSWLNPISVAAGGADFSVFTGMAAAAISYLVLTRGGATLRAANGRRTG